MKKSRRAFIGESAAFLLCSLYSLPGSHTLSKQMHITGHNHKSMNQVEKVNNVYDVVIVGGSYSGLAAAMTLGRSLRRVLVIDSGQPCNRQTPYSHNFITHDGRKPAEIAALAKTQVEVYETVTFKSAKVVGAEKLEGDFLVHCDDGETLKARKLLFSTGIKDQLPALPGFSECWGISLIHCPYCHGYEVRGKKTGIIGNGEYGYDFATFIHHWAPDISLYTNGPADLTAEQRQVLSKMNIPVVEDPIAALKHNNGYLSALVFQNGKEAFAEAVYIKPHSLQHCDLPEQLGCEMTEDGYIRTDFMQKTSVAGIYASGDNVTRMRTVASAVGMGTTAGAMLNRELCIEEVNSRFVKD